MLIELDLNDGVDFIDHCLNYFSFFALDSGAVDIHAVEKITVGLITVRGVKIKHILINVHIEKLFNVVHNASV